MDTKQFILLGPPGVEVASQAAALAERWQIPHVSVAELLPEAADQGGASSEEDSVAVEAQVSDALILKRVRRRFEQPDVMLKGYVLSGFPQTLAQAQAFEEWTSAVDLPPATVVYLKAMTGLLINRLSAGGKYASVSAIRQDLARHEEAVAPLLEHYGQRSQLKTVNGSLPFAEVARELARLGYRNTGAARLIEDEAALDALIEQEGRLVVDCMASWCGSCKQVAPLIDQLAEAYGDRATDNRVTVIKIDFDVNRQLTKRFGLKGIPAVMFFKSGELMETLIGVKSYAEYSAAVERLFP
ncbi:MAG: nucleoside monophosphate kinase [Elainellaceae cyanobacterium]